MERSSLKKSIAFIVCLIMIFSTFSFNVIADGNINLQETTSSKQGFTKTAEEEVINEIPVTFTNFSACWGTNINIGNDYLDYTKTGSIAYAGIVNLNGKVTVSIDWALAGGYNANLYVYAIPLDDGKTTKEADKYYKSISKQKTQEEISNELSLSDDKLIAKLIDYEDNTGGWTNFKTCQLESISDNQIEGNKAIFIKTGRTDEKNDSTGNFKNLVIDVNKDDWKTVNIISSDTIDTSRIKGAKFTNKETEKSYEGKANEGSVLLPIGIYSVEALPFAPATYSADVDKNEITLTEESNESNSPVVTVSNIQVRTGDNDKNENLPQTNFETVKNNTIEWNANGGFKPESLGHINSLEKINDFAVAGTKKGKFTDTDVYMIIDTHSNGGKFHTNGRGSSMQINGGTILKIPVVKDTKVTFDTGSFVYDIDGKEYSGKQSYYYVGENNDYAVIEIKNGGYANSITTEPFSRTTVSGTITNAEAGSVLQLNNENSGEIIYVSPDTNGAYSVNLISGQTYMVSYGTKGQDEVFTVSTTRSPDIGQIVVTEETQTQTQNIEIINEVKMYEIGGDIVDNKDGETFSISNNSNDYTVTIENGKWKTSVPSGKYSFRINSTIDGTLSPLSLNEFSVSEDNSSLKNILILHPIIPNPVDRKTIKVGKTDDCDYSTINDALNAIKAMENLPDSEEDRITIELNGGELFREQVVVTTPYITFTSDPNNPATISWYYGTYHSFYSVNSNGYYDKDLAVAKISRNEVKEWGPTLKTETSATNFIAENIRIENSINLYYTDEERADGVLNIGNNPYDRFLEPGDDGYKAADSKGVETTAAALLTAGDKGEFYNCQIVSSQDTLYTGGSKDKPNDEGNEHTLYFKDCDIEGNVDYIFGCGYVIFDDCGLVTGGYSDTASGGYITANGAVDGKGYYLFRNCVVKNSDVDGRKFSDNPILWGRDWGPDARVYFMNTTVEGDAKMPSGWSGWGNTDKRDLYVYDFNDPTVGENRIDNIHAVLTEKQAYDIYYSSVETLKNWFPTGIVRSESIQISDFDDTGIELNKGDEKQLKATITPNNALYKAVWSSSNDTIVSVDEYGMLKALSAGEAKITVKTADNDAIITECNVTVKENLTPPSYTITSSVLKSSDDETLEEIPENQDFKVELSVEKNDSEITNECLFIALYDEDNTIISVLILPEISEGTTSINVPASDKKINSIKAYAWKSLASMVPLTETFTVK